MTMRSALIACVALSALSGCGAFAGKPFSNPTAEQLAAAAPAPAASPVAATTPVPVAGAVTVDALDTTTEEQRTAALEAAPAAANAALGTTTATLGSPADPGIWLKTGLVSEVKQGKIEWNGQTINIELRPSGGEASAGSQISLPAMRLLNAPLTDILQITVFAG